MSQTAEPATSIKVRVQPKASRNQVVGFTGDTLRLRVTAPPAAGKANQAVIALLCERLGIAKSKVRISRGHSFRDKLIEVESLSSEEIRRRLELLAG